MSQQRIEITEQSHKTRSRSQVFYVVERVDRKGRRLHVLERVLREDALPPIALVPDASRLPRAINSWQVRNHSGEQLCFTQVGGGTERQRDRETEQSVAHREALFRLHHGCDVVVAGLHDVAGAGDRIDVQKQTGVADALY